MKLNPCCKLRCSESFISGEAKTSSQKVGTIYSERKTDLNKYVNKNLVEKFSLMFHLQHFMVKKKHSVGYTMATVGYSVDITCWERGNLGFYKEPFINFNKFIYF